MKGYEDLGVKPVEGYEDLGVSSDASTASSEETTLQKYTPDWVPSVEDTVTGSVDALTGLAQGLGADFTDELSGATTATKQYLTGDRAQSWLENYRKAQKEASAADEASYERSPYLYSTGKGLGMILPALFSAGATAAPQGAAALGRLASAGNILSKYGKIAATGAAMGSAGAVGSSKGEIETEEGRDQLLEDAKTGAKIGSVLSPVMAKTASYVGKKFTQNPTLRQLAKSFKYGTEGVEVSEDKVAKEFWTDKNITAIRGFVDDLLGKDKAISRRYGQIINKATQEGVEVPSTELIKNSVGKLTNIFETNEILKGLPEYEKVRGMLAKINGTGSLNPREMVDLKKVLKSISDQSEIPGFKAVYRATVDDINKQLGTNVNGFNEINDLMSKFREIPETIIGTGKRLGDIDSKLRPQKLEKSVQSFISNLTDPGASEGKINAAIKHRDIVKKLKGLGLPEEEITQLMSKLEGVADDFAITRSILGSEPQSGWKRLLGTALSLGSSTTGEGIALGGANRVGAGLSIPAKGGKALFQMGDAGLQKVSDLLIQSGVPVAKGIGEQLSKGLAEKNLAARNAALFSIVQNPQLKALLGYDNKE